MRDWIEFVAKPKNGTTPIKNNHGQFCWQRPCCDDGWAMFVNKMYAFEGPKLHSRIPS